MNTVNKLGTISRIRMKTEKNLLTKDEFIFFRKNVNNVTRLKPIKTGLIGSKYQ